MIVFKILLIVFFACIFIQDTKDRYVYWFLFPLVGILCGILFYSNTLPELFLNAILLNALFVLGFLLVLYLYTKLKLKTKLLNTMGLGDVCLFFALVASFSTISFIVVFTGALIFSLIFHLYKNGLGDKQTTVPLAGYISIFFMASYLLHWLGFANMVYFI